MEVKVPWLGHLVTFLFKAFYLKWNFFNEIQCCYFTLRSFHQPNYPGGGTQINWCTHALTQISEVLPEQVIAFLQKTPKQGFCGVSHQIWPLKLAKNKNPPLFLENQCFLTPKCKTCILLQKITPFHPTVPPPGKLFIFGYLLAFISCVEPYYNSCPWPWTAATLLIHLQ